MSEKNDVADKSFAGVMTILIALAILIAFITFLVLNLRHWKTQTYKIRVIQRRAAIRTEKKRKKNANSSVVVKDVTTTEFKQFVLNEMIKIVVKMNSLRFKTVYYLTCDKYYHIAIWTYLKLSTLCSKCSKKQEVNQDEDEDKEHAKHFNLLKPLSRFYHLINLSGIVVIWLIVNCIIAFLVELKNSGEAISMTNFLVGVIVATLLGHLLIMVTTKLLHVLYMKNIEDAFEARQTEVNLKKKNPFKDETAKSESAPMLKNEYKDTEKFETKNSQKWDETSRGSSKGFDTARQLVVTTSKPGSAGPSNKVLPVDTESEHLQAPPAQSFIGDTEVLDSESQKSNNSLNTVIFMTMLGFIAFLTLFCCIYTYHHYSQSVILACLLMVILSSLIEVLLLRPLTCLLLTLLTMIKRKVKSKEIMMREIEEVKEELGLNRSQQSKDGISQDVNMDASSKSRMEKESQDLEKSEDSKGKDDEEEEKIETLQQENIMMKELKQDSMVDKMTERPGKKPKGESKSEAAKIARYNIKLLESIYQAYDPEQADNVVKVFRKGGVFSVEPIMEEDLEESMDTQNQDLESQNLTGENGLSPLDLAGSAGLSAAALNGGSKAKLAKKDTLGDIKEENSMLFEDLAEDGDKAGAKNNENGLNADLENPLEADQSEKTGFEFDRSDPFGSMNGDEGFNSIMAAAAANGLAATLAGGESTKKKHKISESSYTYEDETAFGGVTLNPRKRKKRRLKKKKKPQNTAKIRQLEQIYGADQTPSMRGDESVRSRAFKTKASFISKNPQRSIKRDKTRKLSEILSPQSSKKVDIEGMKVFGASGTISASQTSQNWSKKHNLKQLNTSGRNQKRMSTKTKSPKSTLHANEPLFKNKLTNEQAHRNEMIKRNNFLRTSLNAAAKEQVRSRSRGSRVRSKNSEKSSSKGFSQIRKKLARGTNSNRGRSLNQNDFALQTAKIRDQFKTQVRKKIPKRKMSKSPAVVRMDGESPYMEYLPDRYREYKPKEKIIQRKSSNVSFQDFFKKINSAYSETHSIRGRSQSSSRAGISRKGSNSKSLNKMHTLRSTSSVSSRGAGTIKSRQSRLRKKRPQKSQSSNDDSFMKVANMVKEKMAKEKMLKFHP